MSETEDLPARLRRETAELHHGVEAATGLPGSVRDSSDYRLLLQHLHRFHVSVEALLSDPRWAEHWATLDVDLGQHRRSHLIERDLTALGHSWSTEVIPLDDIDGFPRALGCLYVVEGSSLGGRMIGPAIRAVIGEVPTDFFESAGRGHPSPWRSLRAAVHRFGETGGSDASDAVVEGARVTFRHFGQLVASPRAVPTR